MGIVNSSVPFLPVFVARLGGSAFEVSLLTAIPAVSGFLLAIPIGQFLQSRTRIVPWYSRSRAVAHLAYGLAAIAVLIAPPAVIVPVILVIWAIAAIPSTIGIVSFPVVMDGAAGPRGRYQLMGLRWSIMGLTTAITVAVIGIVLEALPFPLNYQLVFIGFSFAGLVSYYFSSQFHLPTAEPPQGLAESPLGRLRETLRTVWAERAFVRFSVRQCVFVAGVRLVMPLIPLYYVLVVDAPDAWIGIIATCQSLALLVGYLFWRSQSVKRGRAFVLLTALLLAALHPAILSFVDELVVVAALAGVAGFFMAGVDLALFDALMTTIPRRYGVTFASMDTAFVNAVGIVAPLTGAALAVTVGLGTALQIGSLISLLGVVLFAADVARERRASRGAGGPAASGPVNDPAGLHDEARAGESAEVNERVALDDDQVRPLPDFDRPDLVPEPEELGSTAGARPDGVDRSGSVLVNESDLARDHLGEDAAQAGVGSGSDRDAELDRPLA
jgi:hypothetical protein